MAKTLTQIHQQTIDLLGRMHCRRHTLTASFDKVAAIHNRYFDNAAEAFDAKGADFYGLPQWTEPMQKSIYAKN